MKENAEKKTDKLLKLKSFEEENGLCKFRCIDGSRFDEMRCPRSENRPSSNVPRKVRSGKRCIQIGANRYELRTIGNVFKEQKDFARERESARKASLLFGSRKISRKRCRPLGRRRPQPGRGPAESRRRRSISGTKAREDELVRNMKTEATIPRASYDRAPKFEAAKRIASTSGKQLVFCRENSRGLDIMATVLKTMGYEQWDHTPQMILKRFVILRKVAV